MCQVCMSRRNVCRILIIHFSKGMMIAVHNIVNVK